MTKSDKEAIAEIGILPNSRVFTYQGALEAYAKGKHDLLEELEALATAETVETHFVAPAGTDEVFDGDDPLGIVRATDLAIAANRSESAGVR